MNVAQVKNLEGKRIFLVEDDVLNLAIVQHVLAGTKASLFQNYNSIGIIAHIKQSLPIDLILVDIKLRGGISGINVGKRLREDPETVAIPIVAISSLDPETVIPQAQGAGFDGFISKPINAATFARDLASIIQGEKLW